MAPAAIHRQTQQRSVSERFVWLSSLLVLASMYPLALGMSLDVYLIARVVFGTPGIGLALSAVLLALLMLLWTVLPRLEGNKNR
jgi:antibiotic biosynthesis monooxygenase (ABM) superfamily enzyme